MSKPKRPIESSSSAGISTKKPCNETTRSPVGRSGGAAGIGSAAAGSSIAAASDLKTGKSPYVVVPSAADEETSRRRNGLSEADGSDLMDLLILGGAAGPTTPIQELALHLLYAPRLMEDAKTIEIPKWSAAAPTDPNRRTEPRQLAISADRTAGQLSILADLTSDSAVLSNLRAFVDERFREQNAVNDRPTRPTYDSMKADQTARSYWNRIAATVVRRRNLLRSDRQPTLILPGGRRTTIVSLRNARFAGSRLRYAPFWIRLQPDADVEPEEPSTCFVPAYAVAWNIDCDTTLQFIVELDANYYLFALIDHDSFYDDDGIIATTDDDVNTLLYFDRQSLADTVCATALGALDVATGQSVAFAMLRASAATADFPDELIVVIVQFLLLPPIPPAMAERIEDYEKQQ